MPGGRSSPAAGHLMTCARGLRNSRPRPLATRPMPVLTGASVGVGSPSALIRCRFQRGSLGARLPSGVVSCSQGHPAAGWALRGFDCGSRGQCGATAAAVQPVGRPVRQNYMDAHDRCVATTALSWSHDGRNV